MIANSSAQPKCTCKNGTFFIYFIFFFIFVVTAGTLISYILSLEYIKTF